MPRWGNRQTLDRESSVERRASSIPARGTNFMPAWRNAYALRLERRHLRDCEFKSRRPYQFEVCFGVAVAKW